MLEKNRKKKEMKIYEKVVGLKQQKIPKKWNKVKREIKG